MNGIVNLPGYQITEQLYVGTRTLVYRGIRTSDQYPVAIKIPRNEYPDFNELLQFRNQYTIAKNLDFPSIIKPLTLEIHGNSYAIIMEDFSGIFLSNYLKIIKDKNQNFKCLPLVEFLEIAIQLTNILHYLYQNRIIQKDIQPANILINPDTKQVKLLDFSLASLLPRETQEIQNTNDLEGTLAYLSPEQTGRMNRGIDYRTDFYSLGITLYELLTGALPFSSEDAMELVHCHLAKKPMPLHQINSEIPLILSKIVSKLMAKNAEDRYQSALGIKHDLENCLTQLQTKDTIEPFEIAKKDISERFLIPEKLYGREAEVNQLLNAFDRVANGTTEMMLVAGFSGIGKTAVVNEVHKPIVRQRGYFIKGKYDQFQRNIPFSAFVQALRDLMGQLLSESDEQLQIWKTKILAAVGDNGQVLIDVIPELERIIGQQPPAIELSGTAAQNCFNFLLNKFLQVFTCKEHPLVIFLDDWQWADSASLNLLKLLMQQDTGYLLILGAYRDREVSPVHPFMLTVDKIVKTGATVNIITLTPLSELELNQLVVETLKCESFLALSLTKLVYQKTKGNPFFAIQFLKALHDEKLIKLDWENQYWQYDLAQINALVITEDVVKFMALQLQNFPLETQEIIKLAACLGAEFDLSTLAIVSKRSPITTATILWELLQEGLVISTTKFYSFLTQADSEQVFDAPANPTYRFVHDRIQQAAYSLIPEDQKQTTHYYIGQLLLHEISPAAREDRIFELVNQLNYGIALMTDQVERDELAQLNLIACRKARAGTAYQAAQEYATIGLNLLGSEAWERQYTITLQLHKIVADSAALTSDFDAMYQSIDAVIEHSKTFLEQVEVYLIKIQALTTQNKFLEAIFCGQLILEKLGITFPHCITPVELQQETEEVKALLADRPIEKLLYLPIMVDPEKQALMKIASRMIPACYFAASPLFPLLASLQVKLSLQYGNSPVSSTGYADYGIFLIFFKKDIATSNQFGQLAYRLASLEPDKSIRAVTFVPVGLYLYHHQFHLRDTIPLFQNGYQAALEVGKLEYVGHNIQGLCISSFWCGQTLTELEPQIRAYYQIMLKFNLITSEKYCLIFLETILFLLDSPNKMQISDEQIDNKDIGFSELLNSHDVTRFFYIYLHRAILRFLFGYLTLAKNDAIKARQYLEGGVATTCEAGLYFYDSLITLGTIFESPAHLELYLKQVEENQAKLYLWATEAPMNYLHKWQLVEAEKYRVLGNKLEAIEMYDRAIAGAREHGYIQEEALANELAAKFYLAWGKEKFAPSYMQEAYYGYARWGAKAKVAHLEQQYPQLLTAILQSHQGRITSEGTILATLMKGITTTSNGHNLWLDFPAVMKATQAISEEMELEKLLATLMQIALVYAGAQTGILVIHQEEKWLVVAKANQNHTENWQIPLAECQELPQSLIHSVVRTQRMAVFNNLSLSEHFASDRYIIAYQPKSVLCIPISKQGKLIAILYLENNLTVGAFTSDRVETLQILTSQAAISIENARLYQQVEKYSQTLEAEVERKTKELSQKASDLEQVLKNLQQTQAQLIQSEKMSALGQLVAGIAHEINNPVTFIHSNLQPTENYVKELLSLLELYQQEYPEQNPVIQAKIQEIELEFISNDLSKILQSMKAGSERITQIIQSLRNFSRLDEGEIKSVDLHKGIESTLLILQNRFQESKNQPQIQIIKEYGNLPLVTCYASEMNQVFLSIISNALDALKDVRKTHQTPSIKIQTEVIEKEQVRIVITDNGMGIPSHIQKRIFEPFFTTKPVGSGTGLGLSVSYVIIKKHGGQLTFDSTLGSGTKFAIEIPIQYRANLPI
ncbi:MAG: AAA family ATPase [Actinomycetota bacterium]